MIIYFCATVACFIAGIAALRCFRIIRYLWYFELIDPEEESDAPEEEWFSLTKASQLCLFYIEQLGKIPFLMFVCLFVFLWH